MAYFDTGVASYIEAEGTVKVFFPVDPKGNAEINCNQCYYFRRNYQNCALNGEIVPYPSRFVGPCCPLKPANDNTINIDGGTENA